MVQPSVRAVVNQGINGCVFAYGQTGSGKTYSMYGSNPDMSSFKAKQLDALTEADLQQYEGFGVAQRSVIELFQLLRNRGGGSDEGEPRDEKEESKLEDDEVQ